MTTPLMFLVKSGDSQSITWFMDELAKRGLLEQALGSSTLSLWCLLKQFFFSRRGDRLRQSHQHPSTIISAFYMGVYFNGGTSLALAGKTGLFLRVKLGDVILF